jgi:hypothetical protein
MSQKSRQSTSKSRRSSRSRRTVASYGTAQQRRIAELEAERDQARKIAAELINGQPVDVVNHSSVQRPVITFVHYKNVTAVHVNGIQRMQEDASGAAAYGVRMMADQIADTGAIVIAEQDLRHLTV